MTYVLHLYEDNRIHSVCEVLPNRNYGGMPIVETLPAGNITDYLYVNGTYIHDPQPEEPEQPKPVEPETDTTSVWDELDAAYQEGVDSV